MTPSASTASPSAAVTVPKSAPSTSARMMSVDALRGFDMFWIIGADSIVTALHSTVKNRVTQGLAWQLEHAEWAGFHFYDLIFPLFVFLSGVALVFSLGKNLDAGGRAAAFKRLFRRASLLFVVALIYSGGFSSPWPNIRLLGVLNRIALCYFFTGLIFLYFKPRAMVAIAVALLAGYWAMMTWIPIRDIRLEKAHLAQLVEQSGDAKTAALIQSSGNPSGVKNSPVWAAAEKMFYSTTNFVTGKYEPGYNLCNHLDFQYLPGKKYDSYWDPEGYLSTLPAIVTCLLGVFAGLLLRSGDFCDKWKVIYLVSFGAAGVIVGFLWGLQFPVVKKIWTSSFVLVAGGYSAILLGVSYQIVDVWKKQTWCQPFVWMGMNSITIYLTSNFLGGFRKLAPRLVGGDVQAWANDKIAQGAGDMLVSIVGLLLAFWFVRFLYQRKIFLRI